MEHDQISLREAKSRVRLRPYSSTGFGAPSRCIIDIGWLLVDRAGDAALIYQERPCSIQRRIALDIDTDKIDATVLALLLLGRHDGDRVWKSFDWDVLGRLHAKGLISNPVGKAKSVVFTEEGLQQAEMHFNRLFAADRRPKRDT
jgi:Domain of unknown function (DUF6429)